MKNKFTSMVCLMAVLFFCSCEKDSSDPETPATNAVPLTFTSAGATRLWLEDETQLEGITLEYRLNGGAWTTYAVGTELSLKDKEQVSFRAGADGNARFSKSESNFYRFRVEGNGTVAASGNIMSLADQQMKTLSIPEDNYFTSLFYGCDRLTAAPELPATDLEYACYSFMFAGCTLLTAAPALPATDLEDWCYYGMFSGCTSLTAAPALPATELEDCCYSHMFDGCISLKYVKALFTVIPTDEYRPLHRWLRSVSFTGTFVKSKDATWDVTGESGIPTGWTVLTE